MTQFLPALRAIACAAAMLALSAGAKAAYVIDATDLGGSVRFVVKTDSGASLIGLQIDLTFDSVFALADGEEFDAFPGSALPEWVTFGTVDDGSMIASAYRRATGVAGATVLGASFGIDAPVSFGAGDPVFDFTLALEGPLQKSLEFTFVGSAFADIESAEAFEGGGRVDVTAPIPEPSTWALMLAGLLGLGLMARRRAA